MPRIISLYRKLAKSIDLTKYLIELKDYSDSHITFVVHSDSISSTYKVTDTVPTNKKASVSESNLTVENLSSSVTTSVSEEEFLKNFPEFLA